MRGKGERKTDEVELVRGKEGSLQKIRMLVIHSFDRQ